MSGVFLQENVLFNCLEVTVGVTSNYSVYTVLRSMGIQYENT